MPPWQLTTPESVALASVILKHHCQRLRLARVPGALSLTGGSSIEGLLTKGDIDLHLRVSPEEFPVSVSRLTVLYETVHPEIWRPWFATFEQPSAKPSVGIAVTTIGSEHDQRFTRTWEQMRSDAAARVQYNHIKRCNTDVETAKSVFFDDLAAHGTQGATILNACRENIT